MLKPLTVDQIEAREMDSIAVLDAPPSQFSKVAHWAFASGGDDLDDFDAAVFDLQGLGAFSVLQYRGQPEGTSSVLVPAGLPDDIKHQLLRFVLKAGGLSARNVQWSNLAVVRPRTGGGRFGQGLAAGLKVAARSVTRGKAAG